MRFSSIAAFAATAHAGGGDVDLSWKTITHKGVTLIGAVGDWDFSDPSVPIPEPPASEKCTTYIPDQKFSGDDAGAFAYYFKQALNPQWNWMDYMASANRDGYVVVGFKNGAPCNGEKGTGKQVFVMETKASSVYGWWHPGAFVSTWQPYAQIAHDTCQKENVKAWPLVVYACEPVNGNWGEWSDFGECKDQAVPILAAECGDNGTKKRTRACNNPAPLNGGQKCKNQDGGQSLTEEESSTCFGYCPPVDGSWGAWSDYGECKESFGDFVLGDTVRCNEAGKQIRIRSCDSPAPAHGGSRCQKTNGPLDITEKQISDCSGFCPPIDGGFTDWSSWGQCSEPCGQGDHSRTRTCTNPPPQYGGATCVGAKSDTGKCNEHACPINGGFSDWSSWDACSLTCGSGEKSKTRTCTNPAPQHGGETCTGPTTDTEKCNEQACPGISAVCNDDNTISVKIDYDRAGSILSASYGTCVASDMAGADASNVKTWDVTLNPSRCGMETKLRTLDYTQKASFTVGRQHGNTQMKFATFEVDSYCSYTSEYTVSFSYGPVNADSFDFSESGGLIGLHFYIASYKDASYEEKADPSSQAGKTIYLKLALDATKNADFDHATSMDASSGKVFVPTKCAVHDANSISYTLFDTSSSNTCANDNIDLKITYNKGDGQSWHIAHTLFLLNDEDTSTFTLSCNVLVCDAAQATECKTAYNCLTT